MASFASSIRPANDVPIQQRDLAVVVRELGPNLAANATSADTSRTAGAPRRRYRARTAGREHLLKYARH